MRPTQRREKAIQEINGVIESGIKGGVLSNRIKWICKENDVKVKSIKRILHLKNS